MHEYCQRTEESLEYEDDGDLGTVPNSQEKKLDELKIRGRIETIQTVKIGLNTCPEIW